MCMYKNVDDFYLMSWDEYQGIVDKLSCSISKYKNDSGISFDFIVPILRGGGTLAISLSHRLNVFGVFPVQYKYMHEDNDKSIYKPHELFFSLELLEDKQKEYHILVTEGNHCTGQTSQMCLDRIKAVLPNAKIFYASVGRDYSYIKKLNHTIYEWYGCLTNESETLTQSECAEMSVISKFVVYPWENVEEEIEEVNASMIYHNNKTE